MGLLHLEVSNFRNFVSASLEDFSPRFNFFYGSNGSGKTSLLEAIYYLSLARSFRGALSGRIIHHQANKLVIFSRMAAGPTQQNHTLGLERDSEGSLKCRFNGNSVASIAEWAQMLPLQIIDSHCHALLEGPPSVRRKYLDWCIFYDYSDYWALWKQFVRALKQRNAALKGPATDLACWDHKLVASALKIDQLRREYAQRLMPLIEESVQNLLEVPSLKISYQPGWNDQKDYTQILSLNLRKDRLLGHTQAGPHKADIQITINNIPAKDILSRGQQKLFVCAMILARGILVQGRANKQLFYLVDDLPSELDEVNRIRLLHQLSRQNAQIFVTAIQKEGIKECLTDQPLKMFHVEQGQVVGEAPLA